MRTRDFADTRKLMYHLFLMDASVFSFEIILKLLLSREKEAKAGFFQW